MGCRRQHRDYDFGAGDRLAKGPGTGGAKGDDRLHSRRIDVEDGQRGTLPDDIPIFEAIG
jgi:hypothetical protein